MLAILLGLGLLVPSTDEAPRNVLLILADDLGVDRVGAYGEVDDPGTTPVLDQLAAGGILFRNAWSRPVCSPSRAALLSGRYGFRNGIGTSIGYWAADVEFSSTETTLADVLGAAGWRTAAVGKWHLSTLVGSATMHPIACGFETHEGTIDSFGKIDPPSVYWNWTKNVADADGARAVEVVDQYVTSVNVDDAAARITSFGDDPWFVWLALNAPHLPLHVPPEELHDYNISSPFIMQVPAYKAAVQAVDTEIGRLLASIDPAVLARTTIVFLGDNGTPSLGSSPPFHPDHAKGTIYEGGVNVPLIVAGAGVDVAGAECTALVQFEDVFATLCELLGVPDETRRDSISFAPLLRAPDLPSPRRWVYTERFKPNGPGPWAERQQAVRDERWKLQRFHEDGVLVSERLIDLHDTPFEWSNLLTEPLDPEAQRAHQRLSRVLADLDREPVPLR